MHCSVEARTNHCVRAYLENGAFLKAEFVRGRGIEIITSEGLHRVLLSNEYTRFQKISRNNTHHEVNLLLVILGGNKEVSRASYFCFWKYSFECSGSGLIVFGLVFSFQFAGQTSPCFSTN